MQAVIQTERQRSGNRLAQELNLQRRGEATQPRVKQRSEQQGELTLCNRQLKFRIKHEID